jgi:hypothetical protein
MWDNTYRTRYVGEALRSVEKARMRYSEDSDATEVLCQGFTCNVLLHIVFYYRTGMLTCELSTWRLARRRRDDAYWMR